MNNIIDERIKTTRNRVFDTTDALAFGKNLSYAMPTKNTSIYRITGMNQLKDILICGYIRPKEGKLKGGHENEVFWSRGSNKLFFYDKTRLILEVSENSLSDNQIGAIPFEELIGIWIFNEEINAFQNELEKYKKIYHDVFIENKTTGKQR